MARTDLTTEAPVAPVGPRIGAAPGAALAAVFGAVARLRRSKPLHPVGRVGTGLLEVTDPRPELGVPAFAQPGSHSCTVRWSRAIGLPHPLPDVEGLALRLDDLQADLLFSGSGTGRFGRYVFVWPRLPLGHGPMSTSLPVRTGVGATLFLVEPLGGGEGPQPPASYRLSYATAGSPLCPIGRLGAVWGEDRPLRFDPVQHPLPGTEQYPVVRALREPSYLSARRSTRA